MVTYLVVYDNGGEYEDHWCYPSLVCESKEVAEEVVAKIYEWFWKVIGTFPVQPNLSHGYIKKCTSEEKKIWEEYIKKNTEIYESCPYGKQIGMNACSAIPKDGEHQKAFYVEEIPFITTEKS